MTIDHELVSEIATQLTDDILYFGWLLQLARIGNPARTNVQSIEAVLDAVIQLHQTQTIVIGNAHEVDGIVPIHPWPEANQDLRKRMKKSIAEADDRNRDFCFWIQLTRHFATE